MSYKLIINSEPGCKPCQPLENFVPVVQSLFPQLEIEQVKEPVPEVRGYPRSTIYFISPGVQDETAVLVGFRGGDAYLDFIRAVVR